MKTLEYLINILSSKDKLIKIIADERAECMTAIEYSEQKRNYLLQDAVQLLEKYSHEDASLLLKRYRSI